MYDFCGSTIKRNVGSAEKEARMDVGVLTALERRRC